MKALAVALSILAGVAVYYAFVQVYNPVPVVVAARNIELMKPITEHDLMVKMVSARDRHPRAFRDPKQVAGSYAASVIVRGQQVLAPHVVRDLGKMAGEALEMAADRTIISVDSRQASWPPVLKAGDLVTVLGVYPEGTRELAVAKVLATDGKSILQEFYALRDAEPTMSGDQLLLSVAVDTVRELVREFHTAVAIYIIPRHPALGGF